jgi:hypothetical protein
MPSAAIWVAIIVAIPAVAASTVAPLLIARQQNRRQDVVARQAAEAAKLLKADNEKTAALLLAANRAAAELSVQADQATQAKLQQIHVLVNSNLTEAQERELAAMKALLVAMREVVALSRKLGLEPASTSLAEITNIEERVAALDRNLAHKIAQTLKADADANAAANANFPSRKSS